MFPEDALLPLSALQHMLYCPRQCALIHVERLWSENRYTLEGRHLHQKADAGKGERRSRGLRPGSGRGDAAKPGAAGELHVTRGMPLRSFRLGLSGKADVAEFHSTPPGQFTAHPGTPSLPHADISAALPYPLEYKRGKPKKDRSDEVQLCAQGLCLEEMLGVAVPGGAIFYGKTRRRTPVVFDDALRRVTLDTIDRLHEMIDGGVTPAAVYEKKKCERCSLKNLCLPTAAGASASRASRYLSRALAESLSSADPPPDS